MRDVRMWNKLKDEGWWVRAGEKAPGGRRLCEPLHKVPYRLTAAFPSSRICQQAQSRTSRDEFSKHS